MKTARMLFCLLLLITSVFAMPRQQTNLPKSRAELTNYEETSRYDDVITFVTELQKLTDKMRIETFGKSVEGRNLPLIIFADPPIAQPREALASGKPVIFVQANIHAGEVEGKEAMLHISRRIATGDLKGLLAKLIILVAPIYNADGNERINLVGREDPNRIIYNRTAQNGPIGGVGSRENANGMDLNRDYMKLESPEANALVGLFNRWDPHLVVDLHTSNGSYHGYHLTYSPTLNPNADARLINFGRNRMLPAITRSMLKLHRFRTYYYGNFATKERINREFDNFEIQRSGRAAQPADKPETKIWRTFDHRPMFGNNYVGLRNRLTILSEAYSYLDFKGRVAVTEAFVEEIFKYSALHAAEITALIKKVDEDAVRGKIPAKGVAFEIRPLDKPVPILVGEVKKAKNPRNGREMTVMIEDRFSPALMPDYGLFAATKSNEVPHAYIFRNEDGMKIVFEKLQAHGIAIEELTAPLSTEVESFVIESVNKAARAFQGHAEVKLKGRPHKENISFPAGSILVRTGQPLASLIFYLLEAESDDGFVRWNFLDAYLEKGKIYPIYKLTTLANVASRLKR